MSRLSLLSTVALFLIATCLITAPFAAVARDASDTQTARPQEAQAPQHTEAGGRRGVSEEGGMKASGPSQAKGGESR